MLLLVRNLGIIKEKKRGITLNKIFQYTNNTRPIVPNSYRFIRSDVPTNITSEEKKWLVDNDITTIVDLREEEERIKKPCPLEHDNRFQYQSLPVTGGNKIPDNVGEVASSYLKMVDAQMEHIIEIIWNASSNVMYFCNAGKDRTGVVSAILLYKMGMDEDYIIEDYMKSKNNLIDILMQFAGVNPEIDINILIPHRQYIQDFLLQFSQEEFSGKYK